MVRVVHHLTRRYAFYRKLTWRLIVLGKQFSELSDKHIEFIGQQKIYFVATAAESGSVNLSPKGGDSLRVINPKQIAWLNLTGSGNESASHVIQTQE